MLFCGQRVAKFPVHCRPLVMAEIDVQRKFPIGAELIAGRGVHFRVWAPASPTAAIQLPGGPNQPAIGFPLRAESSGYFSGFVAHAKAGTRYRVKLARGAYPDPASRFQPDGPHGPSRNERRRRGGLRARRGPCGTIQAKASCLTLVIAPKLIFQSGDSGRGRDLHHEGRQLRP